MVVHTRAAQASSSPPLGEFEIVVLLSVLHVNREGGQSRAYGSTIVQEIAGRTGRDVSRGAVYVTLDRLEGKRLLTSRTGDAPPERGGHPRRYFRATPMGLRAAKHSISVLARMHAGLEPVLGDL
jgi:DNA-binding PadR family transcriptional regulator